MIGRIHSIFLKEKYIYILDISQQKVFIFDFCGNFVNVLDKQGAGPGEYIRIGPLIIDPDENFFEIISPQKILRYNIYCELISERAIPYLSMVSARHNNGVFYFKTDQTTNLVGTEETNSDLIIYKDGEEIKAGFPKRVDGNSWFGINSGGFTFNNQGDLFVSIMYDNTFYQLIDMEALPILTIDFGKHSIDNSIGLRSSENQMKYINKINGKAGFPMLNIYNDQMVAISYLIKQTSDARLYNQTHFRQFIKFNNSDQIFHTKLFKNDITGFPEHVFIGNSIRYMDYNVNYKNKLIDIIIPGKELKDKEAIEITNLGAISVNDNPIIVMMKIKDNQY